MMMTLHFVLALAMIASYASGDDDVCDIGALCSEEGSRCASGTESCCGETHDSFRCTCVKTEDGSLVYDMCLYTDACMRPLCDGETYAPTASAVAPIIVFDETCDVSAPCTVEGSRCTEGTESCCGETYDSLVCDCAKNMDGSLEYVCYNTDACMWPKCETDAPSPTTIANIGTPSSTTSPTKSPIIATPAGSPPATDPTSSAGTSPPTAETPPTDAPTEALPANIVPGDTCGVNGPCLEEGSRCTEGTETCCGETYDSLVCDCAKNADTGNLEYMCYATDACMWPKCETNAPTPASEPDGLTSHAQSQMSWGIMGSTTFLVAITVVWSFLD